jgi:hypothetical protein
MLKFLKLAMALALVFFLGACATKAPSYDYAAFKESRPRSILVLPPVNNSPDLRGTYSVMSSVSYPVAEAGYYVFPVALVDQTFKQNGLSHPAEMHAASLEKLQQIFGADAALYITVEKYGAQYQVITSAVTVAASAKLVDIKTGKVLWTGRASASSEEGQNNQGGLAGMLISAIVKQVLASVGDPGREIASRTNGRLLTPGANGLLHGPRSSMYLKD